MLSKLPYIIPVNYYNGKTTYTALSVQAFRRNRVGYRCVYGYFKAPSTTQKLYSHAYKRDNTIPVSKYK